MCRTPMETEWSDQRQPPWIAYSLRDVRTARAGQIPSLAYLGVRVATLKTQRQIFQGIGNRAEPLVEIDQCIHRQRSDRRLHWLDG